MKFIILFLFVSFSQFTSIAQTTDSSSAKLIGCYEEYKALFAKRGVFHLEDGVYKTVVTFRLNGVCTPYEGQARIEKGKFDLPLLIKNEKGELVSIKSTGRNINKNYDAYKLPLENKVVNGMSPTYIGDTDELMDVFLLDLLKPEGK